MVESVKVDTYQSQPLEEMASGIQDEIFSDNSQIKIQGSSKNIKST